MLVTQPTAVAAIPPALANIDGAGRRSKKDDINSALNAATRTAARLLCQYPGIDLNDQGLVINRCLEFKADLRAKGISYAYEHVRRGGQQLRAEAATMAGTSWTPDDLRQRAQKLYDPQKDVEEQVAEFYAAQARYQIMKVIRNGSGA
jgi:type II secretory pathway pseudopilin PulG